jgi:hypothetical protein
MGSSKSGNWGHKGRPGKWGGSLPNGGEQDSAVAVAKKPIFYGSYDSDYPDYDKLDDDSKAGLQAITNDRLMVFPFKTYEQQITEAEKQGQDTKELSTFFGGIKWKLAQLAVEEGLQPEKDFDPVQLQREIINARKDIKVGTKGHDETRVKWSANAIEVISGKKLNGNAIEMMHNGVEFMEELLELNFNKVNLKEALRHNDELFPSSREREVVSRMIRGWYGSSLDKYALAMQSVAKELGITDGTFHGDGREKLAEDYMNESELSDRKKSLRSAVLKIYLFTQAYYDSFEIKEIPVFRGTGAKEGKTNYVSNPIESWSLSLNTAHSFSLETSDWELDGYVLRRNVSAHDVLFSEAVFPSGLSEEEVVVLGDKEPIKFRTENALSVTKDVDKLTEITNLSASILNMIADPQNTPFEQYKKMKILAEQEANRHYPKKIEEYDSDLVIPKLRDEFFEQTGAVKGNPYANTAPYKKYGVHLTSTEVTQVKKKYNIDFITPMGIDKDGFDYMMGLVFKIIGEQFPLYDDNHKGEYVANLLASSISNDGKYRFDLKKVMSFLQVHTQK